MKKTLIATIALLYSSQLSLVQATKGLRGHRQDSRIERTKQRAKQRQEQRRKTARRILDTRIIGGREAPQGKFPYIAEFSLGCGASLIAPDMLLSVAHCHEVVEASEFAFVGSNRIQQGRQRKVARTIPYPGYDGQTSQYDFMLIQLDRPVLDVELVRLNENPVTPGMITPVRKESRHEDGDNRAGNNGNNNNVNQVGELLTVVGFGVLEEGDSFMSSTLQEAKVPYIPQETCQDWYGKELVDEATMFCAGYKNGGVDSCQGDSGSPILNEDGVQVGVVSWGQGCARKKKPGVYGRVSSVMPWIKENVCEFAVIKPPYCYPETQPPPSDNNPNMANPREDGLVVELDITYDANPNQVAWILVNTDSDSIVDYVAYGEAQNAFAVVNLRYEDLLPGNYTFLVTDSAKNGMGGTITINEILANGSSSLIWADNGNYGAGTMTQFTLPSPQPETVEPESAVAAPSVAGTTVSVARAKDGPF